MYHPVSGINSQIHFVNQILITLLNTLYTFLSYQFIVITACTIYHFFTSGSTPNFSTNSFRDRLLMSSDCLSWTQFEPVLLLYFFFVFSFLVFRLLGSCGRLSWFPISFWAQVNIAHSVVSYRVHARYAVTDKRSPRSFFAGVRRTSQLHRIRQTVNYSNWIWIIWYSCACQWP